MMKEEKRNHQEQGVKGYGKRTTFKEHSLKGTEKLADNEYYLGLDIGTNSVGWAVTNTNYEVLKFHSRRMWGSRLFEEGQTAVDRRTKRSARRRLKRRHWRLSLLEELFASEMAKVDMGFFMRLKESAYHYEDKSDGAKAGNLLFINDDYSDKDYFHEYPTIYHLRDDLMKKGTKDLRKLFLGLHHIIKYRGHFVYEGQTFSVNSNVKESLFNVLRALPFQEDIFRNDDTCEVALEKMIPFLLDKGITKKHKEASITNLKLVTDKKDKNRLSQTINLVIGLTAKLTDIFGSEDEGLDDTQKKLTFSKGVYEENRQTYVDAWSHEIFIIDECKKIYDSIVLSNIKDPGKTLSESKIEKYNEHEKDLKQLKAVLKKHSHTAYIDMFKADVKKGTNYLKYVGRGKIENTSCTQDDFYKYVKKMLETIPDCAEKSEIKQKIDLQTFLPLQRTSGNGVIPYQIHKEELVAILEKGKENFPFLNDKSDGLTVADKIINLFEFRIPYYVGPLNTYHSVKTGGFAWAKRKERGPVLPWNFEDKIDVLRSAEAFISNLTNKCTYLIGEDVLPKASLMYSEFALLNELNNLRYENIPLSVEAKQFLLEEIFKKDHKKMTATRLVTILYDNGFIDKKGSLTGLNGEIKSDLTSYRHMKRILGHNFDATMGEDIILQITLFGESKKMLKHTLEKKYSSVLSDKQVKDLCNLQYREWGRLSKRFLCELYGCPSYGDGEAMTILESLRNTNDNLMQLLSSSYTFMDEIISYKTKELESSSHSAYDMLESLYVSPAVKRSVWQAIRIIDEVNIIRKGAPSRIFIEVTRTNRSKDKGKQSTSRQNKIKALYEAIKQESTEWKEKLEEITRTDSKRFDSKKLFLYYTQQGRCMYSGEMINLEDLFSNTYDIDHIYPRSLTKDDSFHNLVLCKKELNKKKDDNYPIKETIRIKHREWWKQLYDKGFISEKKYKRLTRHDALTAEELNQFIARQIVETNQSVKAVIDILREIYPHTEVVFSKAENVSDFRHDNGFIKVRSVNHFHHAKDAYLNIVVGNVYHEKFTRNSALTNYKQKYTCDMRDFVEQNGMYRSYNLVKLFKGVIVKAGNRDVEIWNKDIHMKIVEKMMHNNDVRVTKRPCEEKGELWNETICKANVSKSKSYIGVKLSNSPLYNVEKYGGKTSLSGSVYVIISYLQESKTKNQIVKEIVQIPLHLKRTLDSSESLISYIAQEKNISRDSIQIVYNKLLKYSKVKIDGFYYYIGGRTGNYIYLDSAIQLCLDSNWNEYIKVLEKFRALYTDNKNTKADSISTTNQKTECEIKISKENNEKLYKHLIDKLRGPLYLKIKYNKSEDLNDIGSKSFSNFSLEEQCLQLLEVLNMLTHMKTTFDIKPLGITMSRVKMGMKLDKVTEFRIINESITGLFVEEVKII